ncbi:MAG: hypothetical protein JST08_16025 [Actinobacteria bacterium]|nr:hypothetical protein [Actinomycetota bacterium]
MSAALKRLRSLSPEVLSPVLFLLAMIGFFLIVPTSQGHPIGSYSIYSVLQTFGTYGLVALALGLTMIAGEFDLSTLGMFALGGMLAVKLGESSAALGIVLVVAIGALAGLIQGALIAFLRLNSMAVTLGGYITMIGLTGTLGHDKSVSYLNVDTAIKLDEPIAEIFSRHSLIVLAAFVLVALLMGFTRLGRAVRAVGGDRKTSRTVGVRVNLVLIGVFTLSGMLAGLAGGLNAYSLATAVTNPGVAPLVFAATAALIGGVTVAGGQGTAAGIAAGALAMSLLQASFGILASPIWVTEIVTGLLLVVAVLLTAPLIRDRIANARQAYESLRARRTAGGID